MAQGRKTGGRQKGSLNRKSRAIAERAVEEGITPLEVMLQTMRDAWGEGKRDLACAVAKDAAPYIHPKLIASTNETEVTHHYVAEIPPLADSDEAWQRQHAPTIQ